MSDCVALEMGEEDINLRVLKPFKRFYNQMIATAFKYGVGSIHTVNKEDFVDAVAHSMKDVWTEELRGPAGAFYDILKEEAAKAENRDVSQLFESIRHRMQELWQEDIIERSNSFKKAKVESKHQQNY